MPEHPDAPVTELERGTQIGAWRIMGSIGRGGMSEVFAVFHDRSGRQAALKVLQREAFARPRAADRFTLEARVLYDLRHRGIPQIFELGYCTDGRPYLVMELLQGATLADAMTRAPVARPLALQILEQLCEVLGAAHDRGVVHRDLKPDNIILIDDGGTTVKLVDWGIAKRLDDQAHRVSLTSTGAIVGTPRYLAPEQARSEPVDARTDVYALGLLAYEVLLGVYPFEADSLGETLLMQMVKPPPSPRRFWSDIPVELERTLLAMLAKDPHHRPPLTAVLAAVLAAQPGAASEVATADRMRTGELDRVETIVEAQPAERPTSRWRPLRR